MLVINILVFILILLFFFYLPGRYLLRLLHYSNKNFIIIASCSVAIGISTFLLTEYLLSWIRFEYVYILPVIIIVTKEIFPTMKEWKKNVRAKALFSLYGATILVGSSFMSYIMWTSGLHDAKGNLLFYGTNAYDAIWHVSLIGNLIHQFPPTHPGLSGEALRGYNFFYDFLLAKIVSFYHFNIFDLYFRYAAILLSVLYGIASLSFAKNFTNNKITTAFFLFLSYFAQSIGEPLLNFLKIPYDSGIVQPMANIVDPSIILSVILLYAATVLLFSKKHKAILLSSCIFGVLPMIKIYTAFLAFIALFGIAVYAFIKERNYTFFLVWLLSGIIAAVTYIPINYGAGSLIFAPFLLYREYMESGVVIPQYKWALKYQVYQDHHNYLRIIQLYVIALALFYIPSAGLRLLQVVNIKSIFKKKFYSYSNLFILIVCILGILIPTFFIQSVAVFVTIQFLWIGYILLLLPTAAGLAYLYKKFDTTKYLIVFIVIIASIPETYSLIMLYSQQPVLVDKYLVRAVESIEKLTIKDSIILVLRKDTSYAVPIVSAVSSRSVYYEPEVLDFLHLERKVQERKSTLRGYTMSLHSCNNKTISETVARMKREGIGYILYEGKNSCLNHVANIRTISSSGPYKLYKI